MIFIFDIKKTNNNNLFINNNILYDQEVIHKNIFVNINNII